MGSLIETPNPLSPRSEILTFLKRSEEGANKDDPDRQRAAAQVRVMLAEKDAREAKGAASVKKKPTR